jgi:chromosome segregation ATPase
MLPLHLAFRHKQEDEDLLELLLIKYPKAVMIKDRRERVPLEHGRESKFSAKLMPLYADAVTAASRLVRGKDSGAPPTPSTLMSNSTVTAGERALLLKDHKEQIAELKLHYETQLRKLKNVSGAQIHHIEEDSGKRIHQIRADYEAQIRDLKEAHERRLAAMRQSHQSNLNHVEKASVETKNAMIERHTKEVAELRALLNNQVNQDKELTDMLEKEVAHLQVALQERRNESEQIAQKHDSLEDDNQNLRNVLNNILSQQITLHEMLARQQEDIQATRSIRNQLIQTLMRQEDGDANAQAIMDMADKIRKKVSSSIMDMKTYSETLEAPKHKNLRGESRIERDRSALRNEHTPMNRIEQARSRECLHEATKAEQYGEIRDDISAMTECSEY